MSDVILMFFVEKSKRKRAPGQDMSEFKFGREGLLWPNLRRQIRFEELAGLR